MREECEDYGFSEKDVDDMKKRISSLDYINNNNNETSSNNNSQSFDISEDILSRSQILNPDGAFGDEEEDNDNLDEASNQSSSFFYVFFSKKS